MSEETTIGEIRSAYGAEQTSIVHAYGDRVSEISGQDSDSVANREHMSYGTVEQIMLDAKVAEAEAVEFRAQLKEAHERYEERLAREHRPVDNRPRSCPARAQAEGRVR